MRHRKRPSNYQNDDNASHHSEKHPRVDSNRRIGKKFDCSLTHNSSTGLRMPVMESFRKAQSNCVPILRLLSAFVKADYPILFFSEFALRRIGTLYRNDLISYSNNQYPSELRHLYDCLINYCDGDERLTVGLSVNEESNMMKHDDLQDLHVLNQLAFTIVIPSSSAMADKVEQMIQGVDWKQSSPVDVQPAANVTENWNPSTVYKRSTAHRIPETILNRSQTLANVVDGVIYNLVQKREKESWTYGDTENTRDYHHKKRKRQERRKKASKVQSRNILSDGYEFNTNLAPGIQCRQANSSAAFARSSHLMHHIHRILGDDLLREMLMNTIVLIPLVPNNSETMSSSYSWVRDCNYFQLCGRPLSMESSTISTVGEKSTKNLNATLYAWDPHETIPRAIMFYCESFSRKAGLPPNHILNLSDKGYGTGADSKSKMLMYSMLQLSATSVRRGKKRRMDFVRIQGEMLCLEIVKNHAKCDYSRLLEHYCPLRIFEKSTSPHQEPSPQTLDIDSNSSSETNKLLKCSFSSVSVGSFIKAVMIRLFPLEFWGSKVNLDVFLDTLMKFISLQRGETFPLKYILHGIRISDMKWLYGGKDPAFVCRFTHEAICYSVKNIFKWLYCYIVIPLLRHSFYITDTQYSKYPVFYRKPIWARITSLALKELLTSQYERVNEYCQRSVKSLAPSTLRFLPKASGLRPIINLAKPYCLPSMAESRTRALSSNMILRKAFEVLKYELKSKPDSIGYGIHYDRIHSRYSKFISQVRETYSHRPYSETNIYYACVDVQRCFDNINQELLYKILEGFITQDEYLVQNYYSIHLSEDRRKFRMKAHVENTSSIVPFYKLMTDQLSLSHKRNIIVDAVKCSVAKRKDILELLHEHLFHNTVVASDYTGHYILKQKTGIAQGSILSTLLCNLYYGFNEVELFDGLVPKDQMDRSESFRNHCIIRVVDDFLFASTNKDDVIRFLEKMHIGMPTQGIKVNVEKSRCSFDFESHFVSVKKVVSTDFKGDQYFSWCGLLFNTITGSVRVDYDRFSGERLSQSTLMKTKGSEGLQLAACMRGILRPRSLSILYDLRMNSLHDVVLNYCQAVLLCILRTNTIISRMDGGYDQNPTFLVSSLEENLEYFYQNIRTRLHLAMTSDSPSTFFSKSFKVESAKWLGFYLFASVLVNRISEKHILLAHVRSRLTMFNPMNRRSLRELADEALNSFHSKLH